MMKGPALGLTPGQAGVLVVAVAVVAILLLVGLFLLKEKTGSQGWRLRVPRAAHRFVSFGVWLVATKVPWKPILIWGPWVLMILVSAYYGIENGRGKKAWERTRAGIEGRGESVAIEDFEPPEVPADESFLAHPAVKDEIRGVHSPELGSLRTMKLPGVAAKIQLDGPRRGMRADAREWLASPGTGTEREAAEELLGKLAPLKARMVSVAEAAERSRFGQRWELSGGTPVLWEVNSGVFTLLDFSAAFSERSILRLRAGEVPGAIEDFEVSVRMCRYASEDPTLIGLLVTIACVLSCENAFWELTQEPCVDLDRLSPGLEFLRFYEPREAILRAMRFERAWVLEAIDYLAANRKEGPMHASSVVRVVPDWAPGWAEECEVFLNEWLFRLGPRGWFGLWKEDYCQYLDRVLYRRNGKDMKRMAVDTPERAEREFKKLDGTFAGCLLSLGSHLGQAATKVLYLESRIALMSTGLELERFRRDRGAYPGSLADLVPEFLPEVPIDVMTGSPLIYRLKPDGTPLLYSVGANGIDEGGVPARSFADLDWVWQLTPTAGQSDFEWSRGEKP